MKTGNKKELTRWQVRMDKTLENKIRELSQIEHRSINQTIIMIIDKYFIDKEKSNSNK